MKKIFTLVVVFVSLLPVSSNLFAKKNSHLRPNKKAGITFLLSTISSTFSPSFGMEKLILDDKIPLNALCATNETTGGGGGSGGLCIIAE